MAKQDGETVNSDVLSENKNENNENIEGEKGKRLYLTCYFGSGFFDEKVELNIAKATRPVFLVKERGASVKNSLYARPADSCAATASRYQAACGIHCSDQRQFSKKLPARFWGMKSMSSSSLNPEVTPLQIPPTALG